MPRVKLKTLVLLFVCFSGTSMIFVLITFDQVDDSLNNGAFGNIMFKFQTRHDLSVGNGIDSVFLRNTSRTWKQDGQVYMGQPDINKIFKNLNISKAQTIRAQLEKAGFSSRNMLQVFRHNSPNISDDEIKLPAKSKRNHDSRLRAVVDTFETCAVVGNSGVLTGSNCGSEIDAHEFVLRTNMAPVESYETDVGKRIDLVSMNSAIAKFYYRCLRSNDTVCYQNVCNYLKNINGSIVWFSKLHGVPSYIYRNVVSALRKLKSDVVVTYPDRQLKIPLQRFWNFDSIPSSGIFLYTLAGTFCRKVSLYGFYPFNQTTSGQRLSFHYYESAGFNNTHNMPVEFDILSELHKTGGLRIVTDSCV